MKRSNLTIFITLLFCNFLIAQEIESNLEEHPVFIEKSQPKLVFGIEGGLNYHHIKGKEMGGDFAHRYGISIEKPFGKFSVGTGFLWKDLGKSSYLEHTFKSEIRNIKEEALTFYEYRNHRVDMKYFSVPLRLQYRLPCNCMYVQGGVEVDFLKSEVDQVESTSFTLREPIPEDRASTFKTINYSFVVGIGFKLHQSEHTRIFMRPEYEYVLNPTKNRVAIYNEKGYSRMRITFGLQYGISR